MTLNTFFQLLEANNLLQDFFKDLFLQSKRNKVTLDNYQQKIKQCLDRKSNPVGYLILWSATQNYQAYKNFSAVFYRAVYNPHKTKKKIKRSYYEHYSRYYG